jgi:hypothetical protein
LGGDSPAHFKRNEMKKEMKKDEIIQRTIDVAPFEVHPRLIPYIKEAMDIYAEEQRKKIEELRDKIDDEIADLDESLTAMCSVIFLTDSEIHTVKEVKKAKGEIKNSIDQILKEN